MLDTGVLVLLGVGLAPIVLMAAVLALERVPVRGAVAWRGPRRSEPLFIPPAEETAAAVRRFRSAAERFSTLDLAWERFSRGRALFLDDIRLAAARRARRARPGARSCPSRCL
jgi:hypothetical protein